MKKVCFLCFFRVYINIVNGSWWPITVLSSTRLLFDTLIGFMPINIFFVLICTYIFSMPSMSLFHPINFKELVRNFSLNLIKEHNKLALLFHLYVLAWHCFVLWRGCCFWDEYWKLLRKIYIRFFGCFYHYDFVFFSS